MEIRKYEKKDYEQVRYICVHDMLDNEKNAPLVKYVELMFCRYYIEFEPENCFVAVDENDVPVGYVYGVSDYDKYQSRMGEYLKGISELNNRTYLPEALIEMYDHAVFKDKYPAHLHIDILPEYQSKGFGSRLITEFCNNIKNQGINGVMLIVGADNGGARRFYERNGFVLLQEKPTGAAYGKFLSEG